MFGSTTKRFGVFCFIILCIIALDHSLKYWVITNLGYKCEIPLIKGVLSLCHTQNPGFILGIDIPSLKYLRLVTLVFKIILLLVVFFYAFKEEGSKKFIRLKILAAAFIFGGGLSNCIDWMINGFLYPGALYYNAPFKFGYGNVIDMIYLPFTYIQIPFSWPIIGGVITCFPIFNIADMFIVLGAIIVFPLILKENTKAKRNRTRTNKINIKKNKKINFSQRSRTKKTKKNSSENANKNK